jgi:dTDP-4-dehydrorhamnose 3,5-epimerase
MRRFKAAWNPEKPMALPKTGIEGCGIVPIPTNPDGRGYLQELYRQSWPGVFPAVQWNAVVSKAGVVRGTHVHVGYDEFYTLPQGRVLLGLADIRRDSPTYRKSEQFEWSAAHGFAVVVPAGVAHTILFKEDSVLLFGLSGYWSAQEEVGCQWDAAELGFVWPHARVVRSERDEMAGSYSAMLQRYETLSLAEKAAHH